MQGRTEGLVEDGILLEEGVCRVCREPRWREEGVQVHAAVVLHRLQHGITMPPLNLQFTADRAARPQPASLAASYMIALALYACNGTLSTVKQARTIV